MRFNILTAMIALASLALSGCGFTPVYATKEGAKLAGLRNVNLFQVNANPEILPLVTSTFEDRQSLAPSSGAAEYDLILEAEEFAQRLAVQIDASVTRFNYTLSAEYILIRRSDGERFSGRAQSIASYNVVTSQYATLFAEQTARRKAAQTLIEELERDILLKLEDEAAEVERLEDEAEQRDRAIEFDSEFTR
ncbi:MAG: hypothetical protein AAGJ87_04145 [Pseudomonadota bacterium]